MPQTRYLIKLSTVRGAGPTQRRFSPYDILHGDEPVASLSATFKVLTSQCIRAGELCQYLSKRSAWRDPNSNRSLSNDLRAGRDDDALSYNR